MLGPISLERLSKVNPILAGQIKTLASLMSEPIGVTRGLATTAEQAALYAQGRESITVVNQMRGLAGMVPIASVENERKVTDAPAGYSWHEFGLAVDVVPFESGQADWNVTHAVWQEIVIKGKQLGLTSGEAWHDMPHLQLTGIFPVAAPTDEVRLLLADGGLDAVWKAAEIPQLSTTYEG